MHGPNVWVVEGVRLSRGDSAGGHDSGLDQEGWTGGRRGGSIGRVEREGVGRGGARGAVHVFTLSLVCRLKNSVGINISS